MLLLSSLRDTSFVDDADDKIIPPIVINERRSKKLVNDSNNINNNYYDDDDNVNNGSDKTDTNCSNVQSLMKDERIEAEKISSIEMLNYQQGKIYQIRCKITNKIYIGSTCKTLAQRLSWHKGKYKWFLNGRGRFKSSFEVLEKNDYKMELIEDYPCSSKVQLFKRERYWSTNNSLNYVNIIENQGLVFEKGRQEYKAENRVINVDAIQARNKEYYLKNVDKLKAKRKEYYYKNVDKIKEYYYKNVDKLKAEHKQYRDNNADKLKAKQKEYRVNNADKLKAVQKEYRGNNADKIKAKFTCPCGGKYTYSGKSTHLKTERHLKYLEELELVDD